MASNELAVAMTPMYYETDEEPKPDGTKNPSYELTMLGQNGVVRSSELTVTQVSDPIIPNGEIVPINLSTTIEKLRRHINIIKVRITCTQLNFKYLP